MNGKESAMSCQGLWILFLSDVGTFSHVILSLQGGRSKGALRMSEKFSCLRITFQFVCRMQHSHFFIFSLPLPFFIQWRQHAFPTILTQLEVPDQASFWNPPGGSSVSSGVYPPQTYPLTSETSENLIMGKISIPMGNAILQADFTWQAPTVFCGRQRAACYSFVFSLNPDNSTRNHLFSCFKEHTGIRGFNSVIRITYPGHKFEG